MNGKEQAIAIIEARIPLYTDIGQINALRECISSIRGASVQRMVGVKPLEWKELFREDRKVEVADTILGRWEIWQFPEGKTYIMKPGEHQGTVFEDSYDEAKAHMERVYLRRITPALAYTEET